jgi:hypothetical protein
MVGHRIARRGRRYERCDVDVKRRLGLAGSSMLSNSQDTHILPLLAA